MCMCVLCFTQMKRVWTVKGFTVSPSLGDSLPESSPLVRGINELLEVKDEHDNKAFFIFYGDNPHQAGSAGSCGHKTQAEIIEPETS